MAHQDNEHEIRIVERWLTKLFKETIMATLADDIAQIPTLAANLATLQTEVTALQAAIAAIQLPETANLQPLEAAVAAVQTTVTDIDAKLTPTPGT